MYDSATWDVARAVARLRQRDLEQHRAFVMTGLDPTSHRMATTRAVSRIRHRSFSAGSAWTALRTQQPECVLTLSRTERSRDRPTVLCIRNESRKTGGVTWIEKQELEQWGHAVHASI
jgi:hypothetical protein